MAFWEDKKLGEMSRAEWESLCDGCARCCLIKLEDIDTGEIITSDVHCKLLDEKTCRCTNYPDRASLVPDCIALSPENVGRIKWMPLTCAYRRLAEGRPLAWWHPLISGDPDTVVAAGISILGRTVSETGVGADEYEDHAVDWPDIDPDDDLEGRGKRRQKREIGK
ncbi:MAG: YcgN family cysteine cluster protein [Alphaproteobacteria bacterium]|nr:YcgN family cysteine cluster protein [Alphaproteobacteria bacterium]